MPVSLTLLLIFTLIPTALMVKQEDFKLCSQSSFCVRQRAFADLIDVTKASSPYKVVPSSIAVDKSAGTVSFTVMNSFANVEFTASLDIYEIGAIRLRMKEKTPLFPRYEGTSDFVIEKKLQRATQFSESQSSNALEIKLKGYTAHIQYSPFTVDLRTKDGKVFAINERSYLNYEHYRNNTENHVIPVEVPAGKETEAEALKESLNKDMGSEQFNGKGDSKPKGPSSIGFDVTFVDSQFVYGLPEHTELALKTTREPYRLYNLDVFEYILDSPMALYGAIPYVLSRTKNSWAGFMWLNAAEMWVDVENVELNGKKSTSLHWKAESGILDLFIFPGSSPQEVTSQLTQVTGAPTLPQRFATAYHQCRWNYNDETDVQEVDAGFDKHQIPYDVLWLDIEHTDGKRYFTWDSNVFPTPQRMQKDLYGKGRRMVTIIDPHIKVDSAYAVSKEAQDQGLFVKDKNGGAFEGWCWPGNSNWLDYTNPAAREYWAKRFLFENYNGSTPSLYTWNDMNEPSVFSGPEITMPKDNLHFGDVEHREVHNLYGMLQHRSTYEGHLLRSKNQDRPFVLSRAFFAGTQRYGPIWTGDNFAKWDHLGASVPMLLSLSVSGMPFVGADVGGFFGNPEPELLVRWYQVGVFQPFFRAHAHIDTKRREPWLFGAENTKLIRKAVQQRYLNLPYIYTLNFEAHVSGNPIMRPMFYEFPDDERSYSIEDQFMLGSSYLVKPVTQAGATTTYVHLPKAIWYDYYSFAQITFETNPVPIRSPIDKTPVLIRGGTITPRRERLRRSSEFMKYDPYTLLIALDEKGSATGTIYVDDGQSYKHEKGKYILSEFKFSGKTLTSSLKKVVGWSNELAKEISQITNRIERIIIIGAKAPASEATIEQKGKQPRKTSVKTVKHKELYGLIVKDPKVLISEEWSISV